MSTNILDRGKIRVGILRGGPSQEYEVSIRSGAEVIKNLPEKYLPVDIFLNREGKWHMGGAPVSIEKIIPAIDVAWNALYGKYGEDGKVQLIFRQFGIPITGSPPLSSAFAMNKNVAKALFSYHGFLTPRHQVIGPKENRLSFITEIFRNFPQPSIIKPMFGSVSGRVTLARDFPSFKKGIESVFQSGDSVIIEEYVPGVEVFVAVLEGSDGETIFSLSPVSPSKHHEYFDRIARFNEGVSHISPAPIPKSAIKEIQNLALSLHKKLGLRQYSGIEFIVSPKGDVYVIEVDTVPELYPSSLLCTSLKASDLSASEFIDHVLQVAMKKNK